MNDPNFVYEELGPQRPPEKPDEECTRAELFRKNMYKELEADPDVMNGDEIWLLSEEQKQARMIKFLSRKKIKHRRKGELEHDPEAARKFPEIAQRLLP